MKIPKNATLALNALRDVVADCGQRVANAHVPAGMQVVTLDQWRAYAYRRGLGGEEAESRQSFYPRRRVPRRKRARWHLGALCMARVRETGPGDSLETTGTGSKDPCLVCPSVARRFVSFVAFVSLSAARRAGRPPATTKERRAMTTQTPGGQRETASFKIADQKIDNLLRRRERQARLPLLHGTGIGISCSDRRRAHDGQCRGNRDVRGHHHAHERARRSSTRPDAFNGSALSPN